MVKSVDTYLDTDAVSLKDVVVGTDSRGNQLSHYVLAERILQVEYHVIHDEATNGGNSETLIYILEGGFRGFHNMSPGELWSEWKTKEEQFWTLLDAGQLPWDLLEDDPAHIDK
mgnify:CR=1 FL=1